MKNASGKLVILSIISLALAAAGIGWWYRYSATHRAVEFWGSGAAQAIRDAPIVELYRFDSSSLPEALQRNELDEIVPFLESPTNRRDISAVRGLTHLRNALLEDRSYLWPAQQRDPSDQWRWILLFRHESSGPRAILVFSPDWQFVTPPGIVDRRAGGPLFTRYEITSITVLSCKPIAAGLKTMLGELAEDSTVPAGQSR